ncbi:hypothetical protein C9374_000535 [Naegleria lovaniensis]|uniref:Uncharacterized protein n=1 Tax=Naegleria lovaniensis TaxID=51637 RepID=A0AA88GYK0_NAELO|nr:uncharacterized protein C9374_000535 [Naegleria lovaniensis]KAG2388371.1 hypothetical protein C9374_000535 [Naegleria lovaniensis]
MIKREGPLHECIQILLQSSSTHQEHSSPNEQFSTTINWNSVVEQFLREYSSCTRFIPDCFPDAHIKSEFMELFKKFMISDSPPNNLERNLSVLRLLLREVTGCEPVLKYDVLEFITKLFTSLMNNNDSTREIQLSCMKCLLNLVHHSSFLRTCLLENETFMNCLDGAVNKTFSKERRLNYEEHFMFGRLLFYMTFDRENAEKFAERKLSVVVTMLNSAMYYFEDWIQHTLNKFGQIYLDDVNDLTFLSNVTISNSISFVPFLLSCIEDIFKSLYNLCIHVESMSDEFYSTTMDMVSLIMKFYTSITVHMTLRKDHVDDNTFYYLKEFKEQLLTLIKHTVQVFTQLPPLFKKKLLSIENTKRVPNVMILFTLVSDYVYYNTNEDVYTDYLTPIVGVLASSLTLSDDETPTLGNECKALLCDWIFENSNWPFPNFTPLIPQQVQEYISFRVAKSIKPTKPMNQDDDDDENDENNEEHEPSSSQQQEPYKDPLDAQDLDTKPLKCLFIGRMSDYNYNFKSLICHFLFKLCTEDVATFTNLCGTGNCLGYLAERGLLSFD